MNFHVEDSKEPMNEHVCYEDDHGNYVVHLTYSFTLIIVQTMTMMIYEDHF